VTRRDKNESEGNAMNRQIRTNENLKLLIDTLASRDGMARQKARKSLVALGSPAVPCLLRTLRNSPVDQVRWEAAKALGALRDARAIPTLVRALEDPDPDVAWLAAEALQTFGKAAWPALLQALLRRGERSAALRQGVHHVLRNQREAGFEDLIVVLLQALEVETIPETVLTTAYAILERMDVLQEKNDPREPRPRKPAKRRRGASLRRQTPRPVAPSSRSSSTRAE
jgi:hypothetical protein